MEEKFTLNEVMVLSDDVKNEIVEKGCSKAGIVGFLLGGAAVGVGWIGASLWKKFRKDATEESKETKETEENPVH
jgi:hypothetical protein